MPATSLVKFMSERRTSGGPLHWGRADIDGAPFRGESVPVLPAEEMEGRLTRVADPHFRIFDLTQKEDAAAYQAVLDRIVNGWAQCLCVSREFIKRESGVAVIVYMEWVEWFMQDGKPMMSQSPCLGRPGHE